MHEWGPLGEVLDGEPSDRNKANVRDLRAVPFAVHSALQFAVRLTSIWNGSPRSPDPRGGRVVALLMLVTVVAAFTILLIVVGILNWLDYRREECELTEVAVRPGFRRPSDPRNFRRWYETYIVVSIGFMWLGAVFVLLPAMR